MFTPDSPKLFHYSKMGKKKNMKKAKGLEQTHGAASIEESIEIDYYRPLLS